MATVGVRLSSVVRAFFHVDHSLLYTFVLSIVAAIVGFLISFFPVNCSSLSPSSSLSMPPILFSSHLQEEGEVLGALEVKGGASGSVV